MIAVANLRFNLPTTVDPQRLSSIDGADCGNAMFYDDFRMPRRNTLNSRAIPPNLTRLVAPQDDRRAFAFVLLRAKTRQSVRKYENVAAIERRLGHAQTYIDRARL